MLNLLRLNYCWTCLPDYSEYDAWGETERLNVVPVWNRPHDPLICDGWENRNLLFEHVYTTMWKIFLQRLRKTTVQADTHSLLNFIISTLALGCCRAVTLGHTSDEKRQTAARTFYVKKQRRMNYVRTHNTPWQKGTLKNKGTKGQDIEPELSLYSRCWHMQSFPCWPRPLGGDQGCVDFPFLHYRAFTEWIQVITQQLINYWRMSWGCRHLPCLNACFLWLCFDWSIRSWQAAHHF